MQAHWLLKGRRTNMNHLVIVRHGFYDRRTNGLTEGGQRQITSVGEKVQSIMTGKSIILTSTSKRARQSADILRGLHGSDLEEYPLLYSDDETVLDMVKMLQLIESYEDQIDVLLLVTHLEWAERFPGHFLENKLNVSIRYPGINKGEALLIDCNAKSLVH